MKLNKFTVIMAVLLMAILAIGAVSAESIDDADASLAIDDGDSDIQLSDSPAEDLSAADTADLNDENSAIDPAYNWEQWVRSALLPRNAALSCRLGFGHSHAAGRVPEAPIFLDVYCKGADPLPKLSAQTVKDGVVSATFKASAPIERATIAWTEDDDSVESASRNWKEAPAGILKNTISAKVPEKATRFYLNLFDIRGGVVSTAGFGWDK